MKHTILIFSIMFSSVAAFSQDTTKAKPVITSTATHNKLVSAPRTYTIIVDEVGINKLLEIISASDAPYATVRKPLMEGIIYQVQHQLADSTKNSKQ